MLNNYAIAEHIPVVCHSDAGGIYQPNSTGLRKIEMPPEYQLLT